MDKLVQLGDYEVLEEYCAYDDFIKSWLLYQEGDYTTSSRLARDGMEKLEVKPPKDDLRWRLVYPVHYYDEIRKIKDTKIGMAIVDINSLKDLNDTYGHDKGDHAIKTVAEIICKVFNPEYVYRIGGDEFAILLIGDDVTHYFDLAKKLNNIFEERMKDESLEPWEKITVAIGATFYRFGDDMESLFKRADQNMYKKKMEM